MVRRSEPSHGCSTSSLRASSPDYWTNSCISPCRKSPSRIFPFMYVALYPFFQIRYLFQYMDSHANDFIGNHGNELYRRSLGLPQETHHRHGSTFTPSLTGKNAVVIVALYVPFPLPLLSLASHLLILLSFPPCFRSLTHSTPQPLTNKSSQNPLLVHPSSDSYLARRLLRPMAQPHSGSGEIHRLPPWCGFQHVPWREGCGCGTGDRGGGDGDGRR